MNGEHRLSIRLPDSLIELIKQDGEKAGESMTDVIRSILRLHYYGRLEK